MRRFVLVAFTIQSLSAAKDSWLGVDKAKHFFLGAFVQSASFSVFRAAGVGRTASLGGASGVTVALATAKELRDRTGEGTPSLKDVGWSLAGAAAISPVLARSK